MSFKYVVFYLGCAAAWLLLLPVLVLSGGALVAYAVFSELGEFLSRGNYKSLDDSTAREMARRMCVGH